MANRFLSNIRINDAYTFPASDGTNNQVIKTDGSGNLSFGQLAADSASVMYKDTFTGDGSTTGFSLANALNDEVQSNIYIDGVYQSKSTYSVSGTTVTFSTAPASGHEIEVISTTGINSGPTAIYTDTFTANGSATAFTLGQTVHDENQTIVFLNGVYQFKGTYTLSGTTLTLDAAPANGVAIEVMSIGSAYSGGDILYDHDFTSAGLMTTNGSGVYSITANNSANWNTAYGWGDHSTQGYITDGNTNWNNSYGFITSSSTETLTNKSGNISMFTNDSNYATQSYVGTQISNLVDSSPAALDTLNELAAALGDDANFSTTVTNSIALKAPLASPSFTGVPSFSLNDGTFIKAVNATSNIASTNIWGYGLYEGGSKIAEISLVRDGSNNQMYVGTTTANQTLRIGTGNKVTALTIDASQNSTFAGNISGVRGFFNSGSTNVVATFTSTDGTATLQCADPTGNVEFGASGNNFVVQPAGGVAQLTVGSSTSTFAGNVGVGGKTPAYGLNLAQGTGTANKIAWTDGTPNFAASIYADSSTDKLTFNTKNASNVETTALEIDISQNATFRGEIRTTNRLAIKETYFGYSASYKVIQVGESAAEKSISLGYDPSGNASGSFSGNEILIPNNIRILAPAANNSGYYGLMMLNSSNKVLLGASNYLMESNYIMALDPATKNVGIGTDSPTAKLDISGMGSGGVTVRIKGAQNMVSNYYYGFMHDGTDIRGLTQSNIFYAGGSVNANTTITDWASLRISTPILNSGSVVTNNYAIYQESSLQKSYFAGNVGINTTVPAHKLEVNGSIKIANTNNRLVFGTPGGTDRRALEGDTSGSLLQVGEGYADIALQGNVGIGATSPGAKLEVKEGHTILGGTQNNYGGNVFTTKLGGYGVLSTGTDRYGSYGWLTFNSNNNYTGSARGFAFTNGYKANEFALLMGTSDQAAPTLGAQGEVGNGQLVFHVNNSADFMFGKVAGDGNGPHLQVNSYSYSSTFQGSSTANMVTYKTGTELNTNVGALVFRDNGNDYCGQITVNGATNTTSYLSASDYRLKEDLKSFDGMSLLEQIQVYDFKWKKENVRTFGVLAHELKEVLPLVVDGDKDEEKYQTVDYSKIVPVLIKAIQELKADNDSLKARIETLENN